MKFICSCFLALIFIGAQVVAPSAQAQDAPAARTERGEYEVKQGALGAALLSFGQQARVQFVFNSAMTRNKNTAGLRGKYSIEDALNVLLAGTGLTYRFSGPRTVVIEPLPDAGNARVLGTLRVEGAAGSGSNAVGVNGSSDETATENSGTYAASSTAFVSKSPKSVLDTPQSVSVLSRQQMSDQNINDLASAMATIPGVTMRPGSSNQSHEFYSRGFLVNKARVDGGAPMMIGSGMEGYFFNPDFDMAMYDHVEILRGADGMYSGYGNPGGVVNLVRKRPLDHPQLLTEAEVGSWSNYRAVVDATGPVGFDGRLRGRAVFTYQDKEYFYDLANDTSSVAFGILESDITDDLVVRAGFSLARKTGLPWQSGLPRYQTGEALGLPRDTCLCYIDSDYKMTTKEVFLQAEYALNPDWVLSANLTRYKQRNQLWVPEPWGGVNAETGKGYGDEWTIWRGTDRNPVRNSADVNLRGGFEFFGRHQDITLGGYYNEGYHKAWQSAAYTYGGAAYRGLIAGIAPGDPVYQGIDVQHFDPRDFRYRPYNAMMEGYWDEGSTEYAFSLNMSSEITERLTVNLGVRYSAYETHDQSRGYCRPYTGLTCDVYAQDESGNWVVVGTQFAGEPTPMGKLNIRNVDRTFSWPPTWSLVYKLADRWSLYGSYTDTYVSNGSQVTPAKEPLDPTTGFNAELGANYLSSDRALSGRAAFFYMTQKGFPERLYDDFEFNDSNGRNLSCCFIGGDDTKLSSVGVDLELTGHLRPNWQISTSYSFNETERHVKSTGYKAPTASIAPRHMFKLWSTYQLTGAGEWLNRLNVGGGVTMQSRTFDSGEICAEYERGLDPATGRPTSTCLRYVPFDFSQGFYAVYSARLGYRLSSRWEASFSANNVSDKVYYARVAPPYNDSWYGEPRNFTLALRGKF